jgi:hypothetical protein
MFWLLCRRCPFGVLVPLHLAWSYSWGLRQRRSKLLDYMFVSDLFVLVPTRWLQERHGVSPDCWSGIECVNIVRNYITLICALQFFGSSQYTEGSDAWNEAIKYIPPLFSLARPGVSYTT